MKNYKQRDKKKLGQKNRMPKHGRSILSVLEIQIKNKAEKIKEESAIELQKIESIQVNKKQSKKVSNSG